MTSIIDYENLMSNGFSDSNTAFRSGVRPRWERKKLAEASSSSSSTDNFDSSSRKPLGMHNGDRFIPNRSCMDMEKASHSLRTSCSTQHSIETDPALDGASNNGDSEYRTALNSAILGADENTPDHRILSFKEKAPTPKGDSVNNLKVLYSSTGTHKSKGSSKIVSRHIPSKAIRILDAPDLMDDYYLNLISWSSTNVLAAALDKTVYLWNASSGSIKELCTLDSTSDAHVASVSWLPDSGSHLAIGTHSGTTELWDVEAEKKIRSMDGHIDRVSSLSWNRHILSSGGRDSIIVNHDVRVAQHNVATLAGHTQEVCGLSWSPDGTTLASGSNDNTLCLWNAGTTSTNTPRYTLTDHQAAVKALAWSPHERNLLATGGGTADRTIKFWNTQTGSCLNSIDTGSQVCNLLWNPYEKEILSSHGYARNQLCLWKYPTMAKVKELEGHTARVLHLACSPTTGTVVSAAADETLRFWDIFAPPTKGSSKRAMDGRTSEKSKKLSKAMHIR